MRILKGISSLLIASTLALPVVGCGHQAGVALPPSASALADPYATALNHLSIFSQALLDVKATATTLHTEQIAHSDGTFSTILDDATYAKVVAGLNVLAVDGTKLSNLLAARATSAQIVTQMAALNADLASQLSPAVVGIKDPASQQRYIVITSLVSFALETVATYTALIPTQEVPLGNRSDLSPHPIAHRFSSADPSGDWADPEGSAPIPAGRSVGVAGRDQREFRQGAQLLALA